MSTAWPQAHIGTHVTKSIYQSSASLTPYLSSVNQSSSLENNLQLERPAATYGPVSRLNNTHGLFNSNHGRPDLVLEEGRRPHQCPAMQASRLQIESTGLTIESYSKPDKFLSESSSPSPSFYPLPPRWGNAYLRAVRWKAGSCYRRLFGIVLIANIVVMLASTAVKLPRIMVLNDDHSTHKLRCELQSAVGSNLFAAVIIRNEHFVNLLYRLCIGKRASKAPFWLRKSLARVYCNGGVHSGCAVAACLWYLLLTGLEIFHNSGLTGSSSFSKPIMLVVWMVLLIMMTCSVPSLRRKHHNLFEVTHRFGGWIVVLLIWVQLITSAIDNGGSTKMQVLLTLVVMPSVWLMSAITLLLAYPWLRLRRMPVRVQRLSSHAIRIHFRGRYHSCRTIRVSDRPLIETHAFAVIGAPGKEKDASIIISRAGDWTARIIDNPPQSFWVKGPDCWGVVRIARLFQKVAIVATGSGIAPCMSLFTGHPDISTRILWSTKSPERTYGSEVIQAVRNADPMAYIIDTTTFGRFDMVQLSYGLYKESEAEAVIVISNPSLTKKVVHELESRGVAAYGPIWDS